MVIDADAIVALKDDLDALRNTTKGVNAARWMLVS